MSSVQDDVRKNFTQGSGVLRCEHRGALDRSLFESSRWLRVSLNERSGAAGGHDAKAAKGRLARHLIQRCAKGGDVERALRAFRDPRFVVAID